MKIKLPPYGKKLYHYLLLGNIPKNDIIINVGAWAWRATDSHDRSKFAIALPFNHNPDQYHWPVKGCDVLVFEQLCMDQKRRDRLAFILSCYGAKKVTIYVFDANEQPIVGSMSIYRM